MGSSPTSVIEAIEVSKNFCLSTCILTKNYCLHRQHADLSHQSLWLLGTQTKVKEQA